MLIHINNQNININNLNPPNLAKEENQENISEINTNNILLKESIVSPTQNQPIQPQCLFSLNSVFCRNHDKAFLKLDQNTFEIAKYGRNI